MIRLVQGVSFEQTCLGRRIAGGRVLVAAVSAEDRDVHGSYEFGRFRRSWLLTFGIG